MCNGTNYRIDRIGVVMIIVNADRILERLKDNKIKNRKTNSVEIKENGRYYKRILIEPGVVGYGEETVPENVLITKETIKAGIDSIIGKPVTIGHDSNEPVGKIIDAYYSLEKEAAVVGFMVCDDKAQRLLEQERLGISCTYDIEDYENKKGTWHNIPFDREITRIAFEAIAVVEKPRYENAREALN